MQSEFFFLFFLGLTQNSLVYWVLPSFIEFFQKLPSFNGFPVLIPSFTGFYLV